MPTVEPNPVAPIGPKSCATPAQPTAPYTVASATAVNQSLESAPSMTDRLKEKVSHVGDKAHAIGDNAKHAAQEKLEQAKENAAEYYQQGRQKATELTHDVENYVRSEPTKSLLAAAGVGFVLGFLLIRR